VAQVAKICKFVNITSFHLKYIACMLVVSIYIYNEDMKMMNYEIMDDLVGN
jgi:hypothetical protein